MPVFVLTEPNIWTVLWLCWNWFARQARTTLFGMRNNVHRALKNSEERTEQWSSELADIAFLSCSLWLTHWCLASSVCRLSLSAPEESAECWRMWCEATWLWPGDVLTPVFVPSTYVFSKTLAFTVPHRISPPLLDVVSQQCTVGTGVVLLRQYHQGQDLTTSPALQICVCECMRLATVALPSDLHRLCPELYCVVQWGILCAFSITGASYVTTCTTFRTFFD